MTPGITIAWPNGKYEERLLEILSTNSVSNIASIEKEIIKNKNLNAYNICYTFFFLLTPW